MNRLLLAVYALIWVSILAGCSSGGGDALPPVSAEKKQQASDLNAIVLKSGGDWSKLSDADKQSLIKIGRSEQGAKMMLLAKTGQLGFRRTKGGPGQGQP